MLKQVKLLEVPVGANFKVWNREFTVLKQEENKVFVLAAEVTATMPFRKYGKEYKVAPNDFRDSTVREYLNGKCIDELSAAGADRNEDILPLTINLKCTMGQHEYGTDTVQAGLLTLEQYGEFHNIIPQSSDMQWWLATPWETPSYSPLTANISYIWSVGSSGNYDAYHHANSYGVRPVLNLNSSLKVMYEDDSNIDDWNDYIKYLHKWAVEHDDVKFAGCVPASFQEWQDCENEENKDE